MPKVDPVWEEWSDLGQASDGKHYAKCKHCGHRLQRNVTRFKQHLVVLCTSVPAEIKQKFAEKAYNQSCVSASEKRKMQADFRSPAAKCVMATPRANTSSYQQAVPTRLSGVTVTNDDDSGSDTDCEASPFPSCSTSGGNGSQRPRSDYPNDHQKPSTSTSSSGPDPVAATRPTERLDLGTKTSVFSFVDCVNVKQQNELDSLWAKALYTNGWSFHSVSNPYLQQFFAKIRPGWKPPTRYMLSNGLLDTTESEVNHSISEAIERAPNISLQLDGWSDVNRSCLINVALYAGRPIFFQSVEPGAQRHDANFIASTIVQCINSQPNPKMVRSVVTDQPSVMTAAWKQVSIKLPWVNCYGCGAHVVNLLAGDFRKMDSVTDVIQKNRMISNFYKSHSMAKEVLAETTRDKYGKPISTILGCPTRWSTEYFMLRRNLRIKGALLSTTVDQRITKELRTSGEVKQTVLDDNFWLSTMRVACLMKPLTAAIQHCEGDDVPVSVMPRIWCHISTQLNSECLTAIGFDISERTVILESVEARKAMNTYPITLASHAVDPRFHGTSTAHLSEAEWQVACDFILLLAHNELLVRLDVLNDIAEYRSKSGQLFGDSLIWEAVNTPSCSKNPARWWTSFAPTRALSKIACILLSMPATAAMVERCNKAYSAQKTKGRNRLTPTRAAKLAKVSYNLRIERTIIAPTPRSEKRFQRSHILTLSASPPVSTPDTAASASLNPTTSTSNTGSTPSLPAMLPDSDCEDDDEIGENEVDEIEESDGTDASDEDNETDEEDEEGMLDDDSTGEIMTGDWVAVRVHPINTKQKSKSRAVMYVACVEESDGSLLQVSFLKRQTDMSYTWPDIEDKSAVDCTDVVLLPKPTEDIRVSKAGSAVRVKLLFSRNSLEAARKSLNIVPTNVR